MSVTYAGSSWRRRASAMLIVVTAVSACCEATIAKNQQLDPRVFALLECIDCLRGEHAIVLRMGDTAVPSLRLALLRGPDPERLRVMRYNLRVSRLEARSHGFAERQELSYRASYLRRATEALLANNSDSARSVLCTSLRMTSPSPADRQYVESVLKRARVACK